MKPTFLDFVDRLALIHLPERKDRYAEMKGELARLGIDIGGAKVSIPHAPKPPDANGFAGRGVYGSYLSHLEIIEAAQEEKLANVWILEDDAIFSRRFGRNQGEVGALLRENPDWDVCYVGHSLTAGLPRPASNLVRHHGPAYLMHSYVVNARAYAPLVAYLRAVIERPAGHPLGGKAYIDAAHTLFRDQHPEMVFLFASPMLSVQRGSPSSLNNAPWYDRNPVTRPLTTGARRFRDALWRWGVKEIGGNEGVSSPDAGGSPATAWP